MIPSYPVDGQDRSAEALLGFLSLANYLPILPALLSGRSSFVGIYELPGLIGQKLKYSCKLFMGQCFRVSRGGAFWRLGM